MFAVKQLRYQFSTWRSNCYRRCFFFGWSIKAVYENN